MVDMYIYIYVSITFYYDITRGYPRVGYGVWGMGEEWENILGSLWLCQNGRGKIHHAKNMENPLFLWSFSTAMGEYLG